MFVDMKAESDSYSEVSTYASLDVPAEGFKRKVMTADICLNGPMFCGIIYIMQFSTIPP